MNVSFSVVMSLFQLGDGYVKLVNFGSSKSMLALDEDAIP